MEIKASENKTVGNIVNPREFDGNFYLTNPDTEDITLFWNNTAYVFPAGQTIKMVIFDATIKDIQEIRKRWAVKIATRMFHKSVTFKKMVKDNEGKSYQTYYNEGQMIEKYVQACLEPRVLGNSVSEKKEVEPIRMSINPKTGKRVTAIFGEADNYNVSLTEKAESAGNGSVNF